jgi:hypothetical protein
MVRNWSAADTETDIFFNPWSLRTHGRQVGWFARPLCIQLCGNNLPNYYTYNQLFDPMVHLSTQCGSSQWCLLVSKPTKLWIYMDILAILVKLLANEHS